MMCVNVNICSECMEKFSEDFKKLETCVEKELVGIKGRIDKLELNDSETNKTLVKLDYKVDVIDANTKELKAEMRKLTDKPGQILDKIILTIIGGVVGYVISSFFV